jgi:hypothetical protein
MLALILLAPHAHAACAIEQDKRPDGVTVVVRALDEPVGCRRVTLESDAPLTVTATVWSPEARRSTPKQDHLRQLPGGGWEIAVPELVVGGRAVFEVGVPGSALVVRLGAPETVTLVGLVHETRVLTLDARHPGWGFADGARAETRVELRFTPPAEGPTQIVPVPAGATDLYAPGLDPVPLGVRVPAGVPEVTIRYTVRGAEPLAARTLPPGTLTLVGPPTPEGAVAWVPSPGPGVTVSPVENGVRFDAPSGGVARWRVATAGADKVVPDVATYLKGLDWRFARQSLPEPAVPVAIRDRLDRPNLLRELLTEVQSLRDGALPGAEPLRPRQLNGAWRSGWATQVERALVFHRFLGQEKFRAGWVLTGEDADPVSLTGFDTMLVVARVGEDNLWVDPACAVCAPGEIGTRWLGKPAIGALPEGMTAVPRASGLLTRALTLNGEQFQADFTAVGAAALWLRERIVGVEPGVRADRLGEALGMPGAALVASAGFGEAGAPVTVSLTGPRPPHDPFADATPWDGGWTDALAPSPASPASPASAPAPADPAVAPAP